MNILSERINIVFWIIELLDGKSEKVNATLIRNREVLNFKRGERNRFSLVIMGQNQ